MLPGRRRGDSPARPTCGEPPHSTISFTEATMRTLVRFVLVLACGAGCGRSNTPDNSNIQTPNDQPIGGPAGLGGGKPIPVGVSQPADATKGPQSGVVPAKGVKALPRIEMKQ